jgi:elongation factor G
MLFTSGAIPRLGRVDDGSSMSDYDPDEIKRKISINLSVLPLEWSGNKINILDASWLRRFVAGRWLGWRCMTRRLLLSVPLRALKWAPN